MFTEKITRIISDLSKLKSIPSHHNLQFPPTKIISQIFYQSFLNCLKHAFIHNLHTRSCIFTPSQLSKSMRFNCRCVVWRRCCAMLCRWEHCSMCEWSDSHWLLCTRDKVFC